MPQQFPRPASRPAAAPANAPTLGAFTVVVTTGRTMPRGMLAEAELHFPDVGLRLVGFAVWEPRERGAALGVTFPAKRYTVNGEARTWQLLRPIDGEDATAADSVRNEIRAAYDAWAAAGGERRQARDDGDRGGRRRREDDDDRRW